ncbi:MAG: hypothetical protein WBP11_09190 [Dokdonella sp.]
MASETTKIPIRNGRFGLAVGLAILAGLTVLLIRIGMLARYSSSMPFWDGWPLEAMGLYKPWLRGEFAWSNLWAWHNEHRIFFTRVLDIGLFIANEMQWDVRVATLASNTLFALMTGMSVYGIRRNTSSLVSWALVFATILAAALPCGWANSYQGFQSCFYFVLLFALLTVYSAATFAFSLGRGILVALFALSAVFSLAAGVLVALAGVTVIAALQGLNDRPGCGPRCLAYRSCWLRYGRSWTLEKGIRIPQRLWNWYMHSRSC